MIVIDVGCAAYGGDESIPYLVEEFKPERVLGFDPACKPAAYELGGACVTEAPLAAWTFAGYVGFVKAGLRGRVEDGGEPVPCFDLAEMIERNASTDDEIVLKLDAEGAEYVLLPHLIDGDADKKLRLAWIEWHCHECGRGGGNQINHMASCEADPAEVERRVEALERRMRCEMHRWNR